jgi:hypothetical protein
MRLQVNSAGNGLADATLRLVTSTRAQGPVGE